MLGPLAPLVLGLPKGTYDPRNLTLWDRITNPDGVFLFNLPHRRAVEHFVWYGLRLDALHGPAQRQ